VLRFLEVDETFPLQPVETQRLQGVRSVRLIQLGLALSIARRRAAAGGPALRALGKHVPQPRHGTAFGAAWQRLAYSDPPVPDHAFVLALRRRFRPEVVALSDYLGRDLVSEWGYDRIG
jgi:hypothetical protein